jgi:hypothetical protein
MAELGSLAGLSCAWLSLTELRSASLAELVSAWTDHQKKLSRLKKNMKNIKKQLYKTYFKSIPFPI